jgi:hypothetical protein
VTTSVSSQLTFKGKGRLDLFYFLRIFLALVCAVQVYAFSSPSFELVESNESFVRFHLEPTDIRVSPLGDLADRCTLYSKNAAYQTFQDGALLSEMIELALPADAQVRLHELQKAVSNPLWQPPQSQGGASLNLGDAQVGAHLMDSGWVRGQRVQRVRLDIAIHKDGTWIRLDSADYRLDFYSSSSSTLSSRSSKSRSLPSAEGASFDALFQESLVNPSQAVRFRQNLKEQFGTATASQSLSPWFQDEEHFRLMIEEDGVYKVTYDFLEAADYQPALRDPAKLALFRGDEEIPLLFVGGEDGQFDREDYFVFLGDKRRGEFSPTSFFSPAQAYFLIEGQATGQRFLMTLAAPDSQDAQDRFFQNRHLETNRYWNPLKLEYLSPYESDHWFWRLFTAVSQPRSHSLTIDLPALVDSLAPEQRHDIQYCMRGVDYDGGSVPGAEHHIVIDIDGVWAGDLEGTSYDEMISNWIALPQNALVEGANTLNFYLPLDRGVSSDQLYLNWIKVNYLRRTELENGLLSLPFSEISEANVKITGLESDELLLLTDTGHRLFGSTYETVSGGFEATFSTQVLQGQGKLVCVEYDRLLEPQGYVFRPNAHLRERAQQADMIVISPEDFRPSLESLMHFHRFDKTVQWVDIESIYNEFSSGHMHSRAIKDFLRYTLLEWDGIAPSYVLFVGKASRANQVKLTNEPLYRTLVPSDWLHTAPYGCTSSDEPFTYIVGSDTLWDRHHVEFTIHPDAFQDLMVGRVSVNNVQQLDDWLLKHEQYREGQFPGPWMETQVHVGDQGESHVFEVGNQAISDYIVPAAFPVAQLHVGGDSPYHGTALDFIDLFNAGTTVLNYNGHGGLGVLSSASIFRATDIRFLTNQGKYPISFAWSCLVGSYDSPDSSSLSELLMKQPQAGSIAFYGSTAKAYLLIDNPFMMNYFSAQYSAQPYTFGQIVHMAEGSLQGLSGGPNVVQMYNLQGDPALVPAFPRQSIFSDDAYIMATDGQHLNLQLHTDPPDLSGEMTIHWHRDRRKPVNFAGRVFGSWTQTFSDGQVVSITLPEDAQPREGLLRFSMNTESGRAVGALPVFQNMPWAGVSGHSPDEARPGEPLDFFFDSNLDIDSIQVVTNAIGAWPENIQNTNRRWMSDSDGTWMARLESVASLNSGSYLSLNRDWADGTMNQNIVKFPGFRARSLFYRFEIYDGEEWTDADGNGRFDSGETWNDENENGQWDPPGEPFIDSNANGLFDVDEEFQDLNEDEVRNSFILVTGASVFIHETEGISFVDSTLTVRAQDADLYIRADWTLATRQLPDRVERQLFYHEEGDEDWHSILHDSVSVSFGVQSFDESLDLPSGPSFYRLDIGPAYKDGEEMPWLGWTHIEDDFLLLTPEQGSAGDLSFPYNWTMRVEPDVLMQPVQLAPSHYAAQAQTLRQPATYQPDVGLLLPGYGFPLRAFELHLRPHAWTTQSFDDQSGHFTCELDENDRFEFYEMSMPLDSVDIVMGRFLAERGVWVREESQWNPEALEISMTPHFTDDVLLPIGTRDEQAPEIDLSVSNQWFAMGDVVPMEPVFQILLEDENGVDLGDGRFPPEIRFDGSSVSLDEVQITETGLNALLQWSPGLLEAGSQHQLWIRVWDLMGNAAEEAIVFVVSTGEGLTFFANHPNPFTDRTVFAWELGSLPRTLRFEIYTTAGRKIRVIKVPTPRIGYDELVWDGRDDQGSPVANGVYFLRMIARGGLTVDHIAKVARLR